VIAGLLFACAALSVLTTVGIILVLLVDTVEFLRAVPIADFLFGTEWSALMNEDPHFGVLPLVAGTFLMSLLAMVVAIPFGLMAAIYLSEYAPERVRAILKPALELLAGIPTIVYGFFGLTFITPDVLKRFLDVEPFNVLAASIAVGILVLPLVASLSEDALRAVPRSLREGAYGLGATRLEVATRIVVPAALSGIVAAVILAVSRAVGETMIVAIIMGSNPQLTWDVRESMQAMTAYIVQVVSGDEARGTTVYYSLFAVGMLLFLLTLLLNIVTQWFVSKFREVYQ
jgi:phosphate transport system permease protein